MIKLNDMTPELQVFLAAMLPLGELRASIPIALTIFRLNWLSAYLISVIGNLAAVLLILLLLEPFFAIISKKSPTCQKFFTWLFERTKKKYNNQMAKYGSAALVAFVALPLPLTGGWTGALIAVLFGIPLKRSFPLIGLGIMIAGLIVLLATLTGITVEKYLGWQALFLILFISGAIYYLWRKKTR